MKKKILRHISIVSLFFVCGWVCLCVTPNRSLCCHATQGEVFVTFPRTDSPKGCNILATLFRDIPEVCKQYLRTETKWLLALLLTAAFALRKSQSKFCIARASNKANRRFLVSMVPFFSHTRRVSLWGFSARLRLTRSLPADVLSGLFVTHSEMNA